MRTKDAMRRFLSLLVALFALSAASAVQAQTIRVNTSNSPYTDSLGQVWSANTGFTGGALADWGAITITNTNDQPLYRTERYGNSFSYAFSIPNGSYQVRLHFSENVLNQPVGARVFSVQMEGATVYPALDVRAEAGASRKALIKTNTVAVSDGQLNLAFAGGGAMVGALEILSSGDTQAPTAPTGLSASAVSSSQINLSWTASTDNVAVTEYRIERCQGAGCSSFAQIGTSTTPSYSSSGLATATTYRYQVRAVDAAGNLSAYSSPATATTQGTASTIRVNTSNSPYTDSLGQLWSANTGFTGGALADWGAITITNTNDQPLYRTERYGSSFSYAFSIPNGSYQVRLHFSENLLTQPVGGRVFSVQMEGAMVYPTLDVRAEAGATRKALIKTNTVTVSDGQLNLAFSPGGAMVGALEILPNDSQAPTAPTGLSASAASSSQINLSWTASTDNVAVTEYRIERCQGAGCNNFAQVATATGTSYSNTGLTASTSYSYRVRASDAATNLSSYSGTSSATTLSGGGDVQAPSTPSGLSATAISNTQINLSWSASTDNVGVTGYDVRRCAGASCTPVSSVGTPTGITFSDTGLAASTTYRYQVAARDAVPNWSTYSSIVSATTQGGADVTPPSAPSGLTATATSSTRVTLNWTAATDNVGVTGYLIERCTGVSCNNFSQITSTGAVLTYLDQGLLTATTYCYRVRAKDAANNLGPYSSTACRALTPASETVNYTYDVHGRVTDVATTSGAQAGVAQTYGYDNAGNRTSNTTTGSSNPPP